MERICEYCKSPFVPKRTDALYCSHSCRQLAYVLRKATENAMEGLNNLTFKPEPSTETGENNPVPQKLTDTNEQTSIINTEKTIYPSISNQINVNKQNTDTKIAVNTDSSSESVSVNSNQINENETYTEYQSSFNRELLELTEDRDYTSKLSLLFYERVAPVLWISIRYKCIVECFLTFSEMKEVHPDVLKEVCNALTSVIQSRYFKYLPQSYPYTNEIIELRDSIKELCLSIDENELLKFRFKWETKLKMIATRYELAQFVPKRKYSELKFTDV